MIFNKKKIKDDNYYMQIAFREAQKAYKKDEVPIGAVIVSLKGKVLAKAHNLSQKKNATKHAEIIAIDKACKRLGQKVLPKCSIYITLEPCIMCATALSYVRISNIIYSSSKEKSGSKNSLENFFKNNKQLYKPKIKRGPLEKETSYILKSFFKSKR